MSVCMSRADKVKSRFTALCPELTMVIRAKPFMDYPSEYYECGVSVTIVKTRRNIRLRATHS